jgi:arabinogalactan endo-1,4-beta-galactosidase
MDVVRAGRTVAILLVVFSIANPAYPEETLLLGGDISALTVIEQAGGIFKQDGRPGDAIRIMTDHGANCFRLRLFVNPTGKNVVVQDLPYTVALAKRIKQAGAKWLLDFHYSDTWADPAHQTKPKAWEGLDVAGLEEAVYRHTRDSLMELKRQDVLPEYVQIGNEITPGMLWPEGRLYGVGDPDEQWENFARFLKAGARAVRETVPNTRIVIHNHCGGDWSKTKWFFKRIEEHAVPYDTIGLSYYPWWHGTLADLRRNLEQCAATFKKDVFVVETAYPYRPFKRSEGQENMLWPQTPVGQQQFLRDLIATVRETPGGRGLGVLWWYPESIPVQGLHIWRGGATAMFDDAGNALPVLNTMK